MTGSSRGAPVRVLIIDQHPAFRRVARELLRLRGYAVVGEVDAAAEVVTAVARLAPDAVLLDIRLGDESGYAVARALARCDSAPAVLLVSVGDYGDGDAEARARSAGARGFLLKGQLAAADLTRFWPDPSGGRVT